MFRQPSGLSDPRREAQVPTRAHRSPEDTGYIKKIPGTTAPARHKFAPQHLAGHGHTDHGRTLGARQLAADNFELVRARGTAQTPVKTLQPATGLRVLQYTGHEGETRFTATGRNIAHGPAGRFPADGRGRIAGQKMPSLDHTVGLEQEKNPPLAAGHGGAVVADSSMHCVRSCREQPPQPRHQLILSGRSFHRRNMMAATDTALKTACMIMGTSKVPVFS